MTISAIITGYASQESVAPSVRLFEDTLKLMSRASKLLCHKVAVAGPERETLSFVFGCQQQSES